jgi:serine/threonine protein kinase
MELADDIFAVPNSSDPFDLERYALKTLRSELNRRGPLPIDECVEIGLALTTALAHLHKNSVVHRDIKPSNIIYLNGLPKLADTGLVGKFDATLSDVGTIGFVAPEGPGTRQADNYSLGKVLSEAATARDRQDFPELPTQISGTQEEQRGLLELNEVFLNACEGNPADRYQTAEEMHEDLLLLRSGERSTNPPALKRPLFLAIISSTALALTLAGKPAAEWTVSSSKATLQADIMLRRAG